MNMQMKLIVVFTCCIPSLSYSQNYTTFSTSADFDGPYTGPWPEATITCNAGSPLVQSAPVGTTFSVSYLFEGAICVIEQAFLDGYSTSYLANGLPYSENCLFQGSNLLQDNECQMLNILDDPGKPYTGGSINRYESVEQFGTIPPLSSSIVEAQCSEGKTVLGGGYSLLSGGDWTLVSLGPSPDGKGYFLEMASNGEEPQEVLVTAICANVKLKSK